MRQQRRLHVCKRGSGNEYVEISDRSPASRRKARGSEGRALQQDQRRHDTFQRPARHFRFP
jgi:hypothetical protein